MTSRFILDEFNLDLASPCFLVTLWLVFVVVVVSPTLSRVVVVDERVFNNGWSNRLRRVAIGGGRARVVNGSLAFAHRRRSRRQSGFLHVESGHCVHYGGGYERCERWGHRQEDAGWDEKRTRKKRLTEKKDSLGWRAVLALRGTESAMSLEVRTGQKRNWVEGRKGKVDQDSFLRSAQHINEQQQPLFGHAWSHQTSSLVPDTQGTIRIRTTPKSETSKSRFAAPLFFSHEHPRDLRAPTTGRRRVKSGFPLRPLYVPLRHSDQPLLLTVPANPAFQYKVNLVKMRQ